MVNGMLTISLPAHWQRGEPGSGEPHREGSKSVSVCLCVCVSVRVNEHACVREKD